ncbi:hypothetical protein CSUNSWCD_2475 [Campylobacter showae CSUNSWCD]|uniref:Uncharacterized protein n=1 Tax=Campylobacter showae CSUNSWCD TaxID=1244083 RepID=M5IPI9_9BACT|nr:hypothetical protein CSUNSWCD_2475 [Campylobacter showae CSUNSWCD]
MPPMAREKGVACEMKNTISYVAQHKNADVAAAAKKAFFVLFFLGLPFSSSSPSTAPIKPTSTTQNIYQYSLSIKLICRPRICKPG